jgi:hypothetical protein
MRSAISPVEPCLLAYPTRIDISIASCLDQRGSSGRWHHRVEGPAPGRCRPVGARQRERSCLVDRPRPDSRTVIGRIGAQSRCP